MQQFNQVFFELEENTSYSPSDITSELLKKYPDLENEVIFPIDMQQENESIPIFLFGQNPSFTIQGNFYNTIITVSDKYSKIIKEIVKTIFDLYQQNGVKIVGIAYTIQEQLDANKISTFKGKYFQNFDTLKTDDIHLSLIREIDVNNDKTRCLEGYSAFGDDFLLHFEFNMIKENFKVLDLDYIYTFITKVTKYKEDKKLCFSH